MMFAVHKNRLLLGANDETPIGGEPTRDVAAKWVPWAVPGARSRCRLPPPSRSISTGAAAGA